MCFRDANFWDIKEKQWLCNFIPGPLHLAGIKKNTRKKCCCILMWFQYDDISRANKSFRPWQDSCKDWWELWWIRQKWWKWGFRVQHGHWFSFDIKMNKCITINISDLKTSCLIISFFVKLYFSFILLLCLWFPAKKATTSPGKGFATAGDRNIKAMLITLWTT